MNRYEQYLKCLSHCKKGDMIDLKVYHGSDGLDHFCQYYGGGGNNFIVSGKIKEILISKKINLLIFNLNQLIVSDFCEHYGARAMWRTHHTYKLPYTYKVFNMLKIHISKVH